jgi:hypothetical protein
LYLKDQFTKRRREMKTGTAVAPKTGFEGTLTIPARNAESGKIRIERFHIGQHKSVRFVNQTDGIVKILIPDGGSLFVPLNGVADADTRLSIPARAELVLQVVEGRKRERYPYAAYCEAISDFAEGGSAPVIVCP